MLYNFGQILNKVQEYLGYNTLDATTDISLQFAKDAVNDTMRESLSEFNYRQAEAPILLPFSHTIYNVQGAYLSGVSIAPSPVGSGISATIIPFPQGSANGFLVNDTVIENYSGISFIGVDASGTTYSGISTQGNEIRLPVSNIVGAQYEMPPKVERIYSVMIPQNSIKLRYMPQYDFDRAVPQGLVIASGIPTYYTNFPGLSPSGNLVIQFYPEPVISQLSGTYFQVHYERKHQDMIQLTDTQRLIPEQFQDIIIDGALERCYVFLSDEKALYHKQRKEKRLEALQDWAENNLDYVYVKRDGDFLSTPAVSAFNTSIQFSL